MISDSFKVLASKALPIVGRALPLRTSFNRSLINSLLYLLDVCSEVIPETRFARAKEKIESLNPELKFSGFLNLLHIDLLKMAENNDIEGVNNIVERLGVEDHYIRELKFLNLSNCDEYYEPLIKNIFSESITREIEFLSLPSSEFEEVKASFCRGLKIFEEAFPDFFMEFQELVGEILLLKGKNLYQGSSTDLFGMIYKSSDHKWEKLTDLFEFFVHEEAHLYLFLVNREDPILLNPTDIYFSPIRKEERPLMGIYHANFVLARVCYVVEKALARNVIPVNERDYCVEFLTTYGDCFFEGLATVKAHAQMTSLGEALLESAIQLVNSTGLKSTKKTA